MPEYEQVAAVILDASRTRAIVVLGVLDGSRHSIREVIDGVLKRYAASHDLPDGLQYHHVTEIPTVAWDAAGLRVATCLDAPVLAAQGEILAPEERILPTSPATPA